LAGIRLTVTASAELPLDECLVGVVTVEAGDQAVTVSSRLNLIEGDVTVDVTGPAGYTARCSWPWPVDALSRWIELAPGQRLRGAIPLLATDTSAPLFPAAGDYTVVASFTATPDATLLSPPAAVRRTAPRTEARAAALRERDVLQSLLSASVLGDAAAGLALLDEADTVTTRALSALAQDRLDAIVAPLDAGDDRSAAAVVIAVAAVLPPGVADGDPRRAPAEALLDEGTDEDVLFRGLQGPT
jgi:hypothetical protein